MTTYTLQIIVEGKDHASGPLSGISSALGRMGTIAGGILGADLLRNIASGIFNVGAQAVGATANFQAMTIGMESLLARELRVNDATLDLSTALGRAAPMAQDLLKQIKDLSIRSPYEMGTVQDTFRLAMAFGFGSQEAMSFTRGILNMGAGIGASNEMLGRMAYNFAQIRMQGKVTAVDIRQLAMAGFDLNSALKDIGAQFGVTINSHEDFNEAIASGKIKWADFATAFEKYADKNFGGASARMSQSLNGLKSTFSDFFLMTMPALLGPAAEVVTGFLNNILSKLMTFADSGQLEVWGASLGEAIGNALGIFDKLGATWESDLLDTKSKINNTVRLLFGPAMAQAVNGLLPSSETIDQVFSTWGNSSLTMKDKVLNSIRLAFGPETAKDVNSFSNNVTGGIDNVKNFVSSRMPQVQDILGKFGDFWKQNGGSISDSIGKIADSLGDLFGSLAGATLDTALFALESFGNYLVENGPAIAENFATFSENAKKVFDALSIIGTLTIGPIIEDIITAFFNLAAAFTNFQAGNYQQGFLDLQAAMSSITIGSIIDNIAASVTKLLGLQGWEKTKEDWTIFFTGLDSFISGLTWGQVLTGIFNAVTSLLGIPGWEETKESWSVFFEGVESLISGLTWETVLTGIFDAVTSLLGIPGWEETKESWSVFFKGINGIVARLGIEGAIRGMIDTVTEFLDLASSFLDMISKIAKVKLPSFGGAGGSAGGGGMSGPGSAGFTPHALGGSVQAGLPYLVGERGPELMWPGRNGTIIPNSELARASQRSAGTGNTTYQTINIQVSGTGDPDAVADRVVRRLKLNGLAV